MKKTVSVLFMFAGILFAICLLISNILATKIILVGSWAAPAGVLIFPIAYILNDVIVEVWGLPKSATDYLVGVRRQYSGGFIFYFGHRGTCCPLLAEPGSIRNHPGKHPADHCGKFNGLPGGLFSERHCDEQGQGAHERERFFG